MEYLNYFISKIEELPFAVTEGIDISILECFLLYTIIILTLRVLINKTFSSLKYAIMFAIGYLAFQCHETYLQSNQCFLMIHSIKNERVLSLVEGNTSYLIASEKFLNDADKIKFHVSHFWDKSGIKQKQTVGIYDENSESDIFKLVNGKLFFKNLQIEIENESNSNYIFSHTFLNTYVESCSVNSILIEDEMSFVPKGIEPKQTVLKATENALILH